VTGEVLPDPKDGKDNKDGKDRDKRREGCQLGYCFCPCCP
jgi:hypothetical protein